MYSLEFDSLVTECVRSVLILDQQGAHPSHHVPQLSRDLPQLLCSVDSSQDDSESLKPRKQVGNHVIACLHG